MKGIFLAVDKTYLGSGLKSIDILLLAQIEEFQRNRSQCYMTTEQFSLLFGESERTVERSLERLDRGNWIIRKTHFVSGSGRGNRQRILMLAADEDKTETPNNGVAIRQENLMEAPEIYNGSAKEYSWERHNGGIKENKKENEKEKLKENRKYIDEILSGMFDTEEEEEEAEEAEERAEEEEEEEIGFQKLSNQKNEGNFFGGLFNGKNKPSLEEIEAAYFKAEEWEDEFTGIKSL